MLMVKNITKKYQILTYKHFTTTLDINHNIKRVDTYASTLSN